MISVEEAQQQYDIALQAFTFAKAEVIAADLVKEELSRDLRCGVIRGDDPSITATDKVFCSSRLAMAEARDALSEAERQLAAALAPKPTPLLEVKLALVQRHDAKLYARYESELKNIDEALDDEARWRRRHIAGNTRQAILRYQVPPEVTA